ncbi:outer membrane homotrimeric porin [uncultured Desulfovibrio sp.]|uniref:outer membrane homotrimeric porin n=1 Tax=uncultured Desulfovibrio sp. TaxID=167968 RepID=UPI002605DD1B|nr:outer membrane homotrimeric porin [uncultured Desulfovibrio sp.]
MKKIATLLLAAGLVFGVATGASAIDFKAKGQWIMSFDYGQHGDFAGGNSSKGGHTGYKKGEDDFEARQRVRLQLDAVASEALSGTVFFEMGDTLWGKADQGGALGADGKIVEVKRAYIDWMVPQTDLKVRMGLQGVALPSFTTGSTVLNDDVAGITASYQFNENVGLTALWARPFNDNSSYTKDYTGKAYDNYMDNMDAFALLVPLSFDGVKVTPWGMYSAIGPNTFRKDDDFRSGPWGAGSYAKAGLFPVMGALHKDGSSANGARKLSSYGDAWWAGLTGEVTAFDPFRFAWDFNYGSVTWDDDGRLNRSGWLASLLFEYKLDWATPGLYGWYGSGDDSNPANGSERMPTLSANNTNNFSNFAFDGDPYIARDGAIGHGMGGTWGIGARLKDMSFVEDLKHTFRVNYIGGTNSPSMGKKLSLNDMYANSGEMGMEAMYLTTQDSALEIGLSNTYQMYENFVINVEADYIALWLDTSKSVWGARHRNAGGGSIPQTNDAWNINASFVYSF